MITPTRLRALSACLALFPPSAALAQAPAAAKPAAPPTEAAAKPAAPPTETAAKPAAPAAPAANPAEGAIAWQDYAPPAFRRALADDRLILLVLESPWSAESNRARSEVFAAPEVVRAVKGGYVAIRERADLRPELARRYPAEGWPAVSLLLPDGSPLQMPGKGEGGELRRVTSGYRDAASMAGLLNEALRYYRASPNEAAALARQRDEEVAKSAVPQRGTTDETLVWSIARELRATFDPERRYFGGAPRLPRFELVEFMYFVGADNDEYRVIGAAALEALASKLADPADGALRRMALGLDWEDPQPEKLLDRNARYLDLLTLSFRDTGARAQRDRAVKVGTFIADRFGRKDGFFATAVAAGYRPEDDVPLSGQNGVAAAALIRAGAALNEPRLLERGLLAAETLRSSRYQAGRLVPRAVVGDVATGAPALDDQAQVAWAFVAAYEATGLPVWLTSARDLVRTTVSNLRSPATGALADMIPQPNAPRPLRSAIYPLAANAEMVRVLVRLFYLTDDRSFANTAREILAAFAGSYTRNPLFVPHFALAAYEYHMPPMTVGVAALQPVPEMDALRWAGLGAPFPFVVVRTFVGRDDAVKMGVPVGPNATLSGFHAGQRSDLVSDPDAVRGALAALRETHVAAEKAKTPTREVPKPIKPPPAQQPPPGEKP